MSLSLDALNKMGAFSGAPVKKQITWESEGEEHVIDVYVRRLSYKTAVSDIRSVKGNDDAVAGRIANCICDDKGKAVFTPADITGEADPKRGPLDHNLTMALLNVIGEVNSLGKQKNSPK